MLSALQLDWLAPADGDTVAIVLIAFVSPLQLLTSVSGCLTGDLPAATGMAVLSATWLSSGLVTLESAPGATTHALGLFLLLAGLAMWAPASAAFAGRLLLPAAVMGTAGVRFALTGAYELSAAGSWEHIAGVVGVILCGLALYAAYRLLHKEIPKPA